MTEQEFQSIAVTMRHWGFAAFVPLHAHSPGHRFLAAAMRPKPTYAHFDPEIMTLAVTTPVSGAASGLMPATRSFHHDLPVDGTYWVCPGRVALRDRVDKTVEYYSFGAYLRAEQQQASSPWALYVLESSAPIIAVSAALSHSSGTQLVDEVEALFARLRPAERRNGGELGCALIGLEPNYVYAGCIEYLYAKYYRTRALQHMFPDLFLLLRHELAWVRESMGAMGERMPDIHALLRNPPPAARRVDSPTSGAYTTQAK